MVDQNLILELDTAGVGVDAEVAAMFDDFSPDEIAGKLIDRKEDEFKPGAILKGIVVGRAGDDIVIDVGLKSEGLIPADEWDDPSSIDPGDEVQVWLESVESDSGHVVVSKRKADRILNWQRIVSSKNEG